MAIYKLILKKGKKAQLPKLDTAEPAFTTDTKELFIGSDQGNIQIAKSDDLKKQKSQSDKMLSSEVSKLSSKLAEQSKTTTGLKNDTKKLLTSKADKDHKHPDLADKAEVDSKLAGKADKVHGHTDLFEMIVDKADKDHEHEEYVDSRELTKELNAVKQITTKKVKQLVDKERLKTELSEKAELFHKHRITDVANLQNSLKENLTDLNDTPSTYTDQAGKALVVKSTEDGVEFATPSTVGAFTDLTDVPSAYTDSGGKLVAVKADTTGLEFITAAAGVTDFTDLGDTPSAYTGEGGKFVRVNTGEDALEFAEAATEETDPVFTAALSTDDTLADDSDTKVPSQSAVKGYVDTALTGKEDSLGFTPEDVSNKSTDDTLADDSDTLYPSQSAVKGYVDTGLSSKEDSLGFTPENVANKSTDGTLADNSDTEYPSEKAVKTYADTKLAKATNITAINDTDIADGEIALFNLTNKDIRTSDKTITTTLGTDDATIPTSKAVKDVTDTKITAFADPNADRIVFWDDSAGAFAALQASTGLTISTTSMTVRAASTSQTGIAELATDAEFTTGTDTSRFVSANQVANVAQTMANKTLTSPVLNTGVSGTAVLDEDNMASNSATQLATQQSIKAYADTKIAKATNVTAINDTGIADGEIAVFNLTNKDVRTSDKTITTSLGTDDTTIPTSKAVKDVTDAKLAKATNVTAINDTGIADGEIAVFNLTNKDIRTSDKTLPAGDVVGTSDTQTLTNKTLTSPTVNTPTLVLADTSPTADGSIGFDRTGEDLQIGDGSASQVVHMGAWTSFTPSWTNLTVGNGTNTGYYCQIGKSIFVKAKCVLGSTSSVGGAIYIAHPVTASSNTGARDITGQVNIVDATGDTYWGAMQADVSNPTTLSLVRVFNAGGTYAIGASTSSSIPMTWTTSDYITVFLTYEAA